MGQEAVPSLANDDIMQRFKSSDVKPGPATPHRSQSAEPTRTGGKAVNAAIAIAHVLTTCFVKGWDNKISERAKRGRGRIWQSQNSARKYGDGQRERRLLLRSFHARNAMRWVRGSEQPSVGAIPYVLLRKF